MPLLRSLGLAALTLALSASAAAQARLQIIHNAADPAAAEVDVYVNGSLLLDDFAFRTATPFLDVPAGVPLRVAVAPGASSGVGDAVFAQSYTLPDGSATQLIANGVLAPDDFAANPDGVAIAFDLLVGGDAVEGGPASTVAVRAVHGATDAPTVDVRVAGNVLLDDLTYTDVTGYLALPAEGYQLDVTTANGNPVASFAADLSGAGGGAATVLASGFLDPAANQGGPGFGLLAVFPDGATALLPNITPARLQVIHNAADPAAAEVDVYLNGTLALNNFAFRTATPFLELQAGTYEVAVAPGTSSSAADALLTQSYTLAAGSSTQLIANGVLAPDDFADNPDGVSTAFELLVGADALQTAATPGEVSVRAVHGATDAPTVDVRTGGMVLVDDATYTDVTGYLSVPAANYVLDVTLADGTPVASFEAALALPDTAVTVLASGFLDPAANQDGAAFGLLAVFPDGSAALLPAATPTARLQVIHNAADPAAAEVDVYVNGSLLLDDFAFRTATPFLDVPAGVALDVAIAPGTSTGVGDAVFAQSYTLPDGSATQLVANGVLAPDDFAANPDGVAIAFELLVGADAREASADEDKVAVRVVHGATDAPTVDVRTGGAVLVDDASYTDVTGYLEVDPADTVLDVTLADGTPVVSFTAPLADAAGASVTVLASGFLDPSANQDGAAFGLLAVFPDGASVLLPVATGADEAASGEALTLGAVAPNPLRGAGTVTFSLDAPGAARLALYDALGRQVAVLADGEFSADPQAARLDTAGLAAGVYVLRLDAATGARTQTLTVVR